MAGQRRALDRRVDGASVGHHHRAQSASLEASKSLAKLVDTDAALAAGELSDQQAEAICGAAGAPGADPTDEARLLEIARRRELRELREEAARVRARAEDEGTRAKRLHDQRSLRTWKGDDGSWNLSVRNTPEVGAEFEAALSSLRESLFQSARRAGRHESGEAYGADALAELIRRAVAAEAAVGSAGRGAGSGAAGVGAAGGTGGTDGDVSEQADRDGADPDDGVSEATGDAPARTAAAPARTAAASDPAGDVPAPTSDTGLEAQPVTRSRRPDTKIIVLVDYEAIKRGWAEGDERCEIAGAGPISVAAARSMMTDAFGAAIVTNGVDVFTVAHLGRSVSEYQRSALEARGYRCEVPGCDATRGLEIDHIEDWHLTFRTKLALLAWLCKRHHFDKTHRGGRLLGPPGNRRWVAPPSQPGHDPAGDLSAA